jgi:hypothetical protein
MTRLGGVELRVSRGYDVEVVLRLTPRNWSRVRRGLPLRIRGRGYRYEAEFYWDYWIFSGAPDYAVRVEYGEDAAVGFDGKLSDIEIRQLT